jgi:hypothetical protein
MALVVNVAKALEEKETELAYYRGIYLLLRNYESAEAEYQEKRTEAMNEWHKAKALELTRSLTEDSFKSISMGTVGWRDSFSSNPGTVELRMVISRGNVNVDDFDASFTEPKPVKPAGNLSLPIYCDSKGRELQPAFVIQNLEAQVRTLKVLDPNARISDTEWLRITKM